MNSATWASSVPLPRLAVIDTFTKVRPSRDKNETPYDADYRAMSLLQELATEIGIAIVAIHHQRKLESDDPLDTASGSTGLTGAADSVLVLGRDGQGTTLNGRGRDIDDIEVALSFDKTTGRWSILGDAQEVRRSESRSSILAALKAAPAPMTPAEIAIVTGIERNTVDAQLHRMMKAARCFREPEADMRIQIYDPRKKRKERKIVGFQRFQACFLHFLYFLRGSNN